MKRFTLLTGLALFASALCISCSSEDVLPQGEETVTETETQKPDVYKPFEFSLTKTDTEIIKAGNYWGNEIASIYAKWGDNFTISPINMQTTLMMIANGASESGVREISNALDLGAYSLQEINDSYGKILEGLNSGNDPDVSFSLANYFWLRPDLNASPTLLQTMEKVYSASIDIDTLENVTPRLDEWTKKNTNGLFEFFPTGILNDNDGFSFINACYFKGEWKEKFDKSLTKKELFNNFDGSSSDVDMMVKNKSELPYTITENYAMVRLDYGKGDFCMILYLPAETESLVENLRTIDWNQEMTTKKLDVLKFPRFSIAFQTTTEVKDYLRSKGVTEIFKTMPVIDESLGVNHFYQSTVVKVDENGTEAAAISGGMSIISGAPSSLVFDRPFAYAIVEKSTGCVLFEGCVMNFQLPNINFQK